MWGRKISLEKIKNESCITLVRKVFRWHFYIHFTIILYNYFYFGNQQFNKLWDEVSTCILITPTDFPYIYFHFILIIWQLLINLSSNVCRVHFYFWDLVWIYANNKYQFGCTIYTLIEKKHLLIFFLFFKTA